MVTIMGCYEMGQFSDSHCNVNSRSSASVSGWMDDTEWNSHRNKLAFSSSLICQGSGGRGKEGHVKGGAEERGNKEDKGKGGQEEGRGEEWGGGEEMEGG